MVQFNAGTGVKKEFYRHFLAYLATHGYICCLWDYRGSGESAPKSLRGCGYTFSDYGTKDMPAIKSFLEDRFPELPFYFVVHSVGGQQVGFIEKLDNVKGMVAFAVSTGYLPFMPLAYRIRSFYFFFIFTPISNILAGYVKAKPFGYMENLPKNVVVEWRKWCVRKHYLFDERFLGKTVPKGQFDQLPFPIHVFNTSDDTISSKQNIDNLWKHIKSVEPISFTEVSPKELKVKEIGHLGFFRRRFRDTIWQDALSKLEQMYLKP